MTCVGIHKKESFYYRHRLAYIKRSSTKRDPPFQKDLFIIYVLYYSRFLIIVNVQVNNNLAYKSQV